MHLCRHVNWDSKTITMYLPPPCIRRQFLGHFRICIRRHSGRQRRTEIWYKKTLGGASLRTIRRQNKKTNVIPLFSRRRRRRRRLRRLRRDYTNNFFYGLPHLGPRRASARKKISTVFPTWGLVARQREKKISGGFLPR